MRSQTVLRIPVMKEQGSFPKKECENQTVGAPGLANGGTKRCWCHVREDRDAEGGREWGGGSPPVTAFPLGEGLGRGRAPSPEEKFLILDLK